MPPQPIITLTTDFGTTDPYLASVKGVILSLNPSALLLDVSHAVRPQQVRQGAFLLETALPYLPDGAVHLAVVDPGVGTDRRAIAIATSQATFVGPDNGLLSAALPQELRASAADTGSAVPLPPGLRCVALTNARYHRHPVSPTFHGRDIFAPAAAHISLDVPLSDLGVPLEEIVALPPFRARRREDGSLTGRVVHVDTFGNLITDVRGEDLPSNRVTVSVAGRDISGLSPTYAGTQGLTALIGGSGFLEVALDGGSAAAALAADIGEPVSLVAQP